MGRDGGGSARNVLERGVLHTLKLTMNESHKTNCESNRKLLRPHACEKPVPMRGRGRLTI